MPNSISSVVAHIPPSQSLGNVEIISTESTLNRVPLHRLMSVQRRLAFEIKSHLNEERSIAMSMCMSHAIKQHNPEMPATADYIWNDHSGDMVKSGAFHRCNNAHCPSCNVKRQRDERQQLYDALKFYSQRTDCKIIFLTLTHSKQRCISLNYEIQSRFISTLNKTVNTLNEKYGEKKNYSQHTDRVDWRTILEHTFSANWVRDEEGWYKSVHTHQHCLLMIGSNVPEDEVKLKLSRAYRKHLAKYGVLKLELFDEHSFRWDVPDLQTIKSIDDLSQYLASKMSKVEKNIKGLSYEVTSSRNKGLSIGGLLTRIYNNECSEDVRVYQEFIRTQRGKQSTRMSKGYRQLCKLLVAYASDIEAELIEEQLRDKFSTLSMDSEMFDHWSWIERLKMESEVKARTQPDKIVRLSPSLTNLVVRECGSVDRLDDVVYGFFSAGRHSDFIEFLEIETRMLLEYDWIDDYLESRCTLVRSRMLQIEYESLRDKIKKFILPIDWGDLQSTNDIFLNECSH